MQNTMQQIQNIIFVIFLVSSREKIGNSVRKLIKFELVKRVFVGKYKTISNVKRNITLTLLQ